MNTIKGKLKRKGSTEQVTDSFRKREFILEDDSTEYVQTLSMQVTQDRVSLLDKFNEGDRLNVYFNLRGREWTSPKDGQVKVFNTIEAWKIESESSTESVSSDEPKDDLPF